MVNPIPSLPGYPTARLSCAVENAQETASGTSVAVWRKETGMKSEVRGVYVGGGILADLTRAGRGVRQWEGKERGERKVVLSN